MSTTVSIQKRSSRKVHKISRADTSVLPEELRPQPPPRDSPAGRLMPDVRRRLRSDDDTEGAEVTTRAPPRKRPRRQYDPYSQKPTPIALRHPRRN